MAIHQSPNEKFINNWIIMNASGKPQLSFDKNLLINGFFGNLILCHSLCILFFHSSPTYFSDGGGRVEHDNEHCELFLLPNLQLNIG